MFSTFDIISVVETTLGANQKLDDSVRLQWNIDGCLAGLTDCGQLPVRTPARKHADDPSSLQICLKPMEIRTFKAKVKFN